MRVLCLVYSRTEASGFYRTGGVIPDLRKKMPGVEFDLVQWDEVVLHWQVIMGYDLIMMQRPFSQEAMNLCGYIKNFHIPIWVDYDDYLLDVPSSNPRSRIYTPAVVEMIKNIIKLADVVSVTTQAMATALKDLNSRIVVIPNAFNDTILSTKQIVGKREKLIYWRGTESHLFDLLIFAESVNKLTHDLEDYQFLFQGFRPWFLEPRENIFQMDELDLMLYFAQIMKQKPAVMQVPLNDSLFNRCKSNIALIEGSYFGAICVVPDWDEWRLPGAMTYKGIDDFYDVVKAAGLADKKVPNARAWEYICDNLLLTKVNVKRIELINSLV